MQAIQAVLLGRHPLHAAPHAVWGCRLQGCTHSTSDSHAPVRARLVAVPGRETAGKLSLSITSLTLGSLTNATNIFTHIRLENGRHGPMLVVSMTCLQRYVCCMEFMALGVSAGAHWRGPGLWTLQAPAHSGTRQPAAVPALAPLPHCSVRPRAPRDLLC